MNDARKSAHLLVSVLLMDGTSFDVIVDDQLNVLPTFATPRVEKKARRALIPGCAQHAATHTQLRNVRLSRYFFAYQNSHGYVVAFDVVSRRCRPQGKFRCSGALRRFMRGCQPGLVLRRPGWQLLLASVGRLWKTFFVFPCSALLAYPPPSQPSSPSPSFPPLPPLRMRTID